MVLDDAVMHVGMLGVPTATGDPFCAGGAVLRFFCALCGILDPAVRKSERKQSQVGQDDANQAFSLAKRVELSLPVEPPSPSA